MPDVLGPPAAFPDVPETVSRSPFERLARFHAQRYEDAPTISTGLYSRMGEPFHLPEWMNRVGFYSYVGAPVDTTMGDAVGTSHAANQHFSQHQAYGSGPQYGARLEYEINPWLKAALEAWRAQHDASTASGQPRGDWKHGYQYWIDQATISPSLQLQAKHALGPITPYLGAGPTWTRTEMGDHIGSSPPSMDFGGQLYGGLKADMSRYIPGLHAILEGKYHRSRVLTADPEGAINGRLGNAAVLFGLGYELGQRRRSQEGLP